jgi:hypothetical protein
MQGIYTYIPETNHVPKEYNVAAILSLLFMVPISLTPALAVMNFHISIFRRKCAVLNMAVFGSSLTSWFPGMVIIIIIIIIPLVYIFILQQTFQVDAPFNYVISLTLSSPVMTFGIIILILFFICYSFGGLERVNPLQLKKL